MTGNRADPQAELARAEAEIARLEAIVAARPGDVRARRFLGWEREHAARVRRFLASCGVKS